MIVSVKLFAAAKEIAGAPEIYVELPASCDVSSLKRAIQEQFPALAPLLSRSSFAVDQRYVTDQFPLSRDQEIAFIPPVSGG